MVWVKDTTIKVGHWIRDTSKLETVNVASTKTRHRYIIGIATCAVALTAPIIIKQLKEKLRL